MTQLNPQFMIAPSPECIFLDKATGEPLANGYVKFFSDNARTIPKPIYTLTGTPGSYTYVPIVNPVPLTSIGTLSDGFNNDITPYYFPFDADGNPELYFLQVYSSGNVFQFSRQAWPNFSGGGPTSEELLNYIPNGQFLLHNDLPADPANGYIAGQIRQALTIVGQGGWQFSRPSGSGATDIVTFDLIGSFVTNPSASPRYAFRLNTTVAGVGDTFKYLQVVFGDVNKFASNTQEFTFSFTGQSNGSGSLNVSILLIKNYGTGGSATVTKNIGTISVGTSYTLYQIQGYVWDDNIGKTIGPNNDDYCAIAFSFLTNTSQDISITDVIQTDGNVTIQTFPITTNERFIVDSLVTPVPAHDGSTFGLPVVETLSGFDVDSSVVGSITASLQSTMNYSFLCNGSHYLTSGYQSNGIPNSRLQKLLFSLGGSALVPIYGTGLTYSTAQVDSSVNPTVIRIHTNTAGTAAAASDGAVATGFTFSQMAVGSTTYGVLAPIGAGIVFVWNHAFGAVTASTAGTSGFTLTTIRTGTANTAQITQVATVAATALASKYFTYQIPGTTDYYVWFKVSGTGTDPAPGGTGILVNLLTGDTAQTVAQKIANVLSAFEADYITVNKTGATLTPGSYFNFNSLGGSPTAFYVWYSVNGSGTDPAPLGGTGIKVNVVTADTSAIICTKTVIAINSLYYAVPDLRGQYLIGLDIANNYDSGPRYSFVDGIFGYNVGTYELDQVLSHSHSYTLPTFVNTAPAGGAAAVANGTTNPQTGSTGGQENRTYNSAVNYFIHY